MSPSPGPAVPAASAAPTEDATLTEAQLEQLMGPIALYPDALIALILPAATEPTEIVLAARYLAAKNPADLIEKQSWSESVKGLARYPDVVAWMDTNLAWTQQVGEAFIVQPADLMNAVQRLRSQARAVGTLTDSPEQRVVVEEQIIRIEPAQVNVIYVPRYDPAIVYISRPLGLRSSFISFGFGYSTGIWLTNACDWHHRRVLVIDHSYRARYYNRPFIPVYSYARPHPAFHRWIPPRRVSRPRPEFSHASRSAVARPATIVGTPAHRNDARPSRVEQRQVQINRTPTTRLQSRDRSDDNDRSDHRKSPADSRRATSPKIDKPTTAPAGSTLRSGEPAESVFRAPTHPQRPSERITRPAQQRDNRWPPRPAPEPNRAQRSVEEKQPNRPVERSENRVNNRERGRSNDRPSSPSSDRASERSDSRERRSR